MRNMLILSAALLSGCASITPHYSSTEWEHVSHPAVGPPFGPRSEEDSLDQLNLVMGWKYKRCYAEITTGYRLTDGGFYGPNWTGGVRAGVMLYGSK